MDLPGWTRLERRFNPVLIQASVAVSFYGSACGPVIVSVFKTDERRALPSLVGSTPTRFRHLLTT